MSRGSLLRTNRAPSSSRPAVTDWRHRGACRDVDPDLFFPDGSTGPALLQAEEAKLICRQHCPVVTECLRWALETDQKYGVWGGTSEADRRTMKRRAARNRSRGGQEETA
ncbi:WhiB family redox-sensing transcriptional regulator [Streptomyces filamentosus]